MNNSVNNSNNSSNNEINIQEIIGIALQTKPSQIIITVKNPLNKILSSVTYYPIEVSLSETQQFIVEKRYNEFEALYQVLQMKYLNFKFPEFPSKLQLFHKDQTRTKAFQDILNSILKYADMYPEKRADFIRSLFKGKQRIQRLSFVQIEDNNSQKSKSQQDLNSSFNSQQSNQKEEITTSLTQNINTDSNFQTPKADFVQHRKTTSITFQNLNLNQNELETKQKNEIETNTQLQGQTTPRQAISKESASSQQIQEILSDDEEKISNFDKKMQIKFYLKNEFVDYYVKFQGHDMLLFSKIHDSNFSKLICIHQIQIEKSQDDPTIIEMFHEYDYKPIQIKTKNEEASEKRIQELTEISQKTQQDSSNSFNSIGKLVIYIHKCSELKLGYNEPVIVRLKTNHFTFDSSIHMHTQYGVIFKQEFSIPISNPYEIIYFEFINITNDGWLRQKLKENIVGKSKFQFADIFSQTCGKEIRNINLEIEDEQTNITNSQNIVEQKKKNRFVRLNIRNDSNRLSIFTQNPHNYEEGDIKKPSLEAFLLGVQRLKRMIGFTEEFLKNLENIYNFKYPYVSQLVYFLILLYIIFCDVKNIFTHIALMIAGSCLYYQKNVNEYVNNFFEKYLLQKVNDYYSEPTFYTDDEKTFESFRNSFKKINIQNMQIDDSEDKNESIIQKYYSLKKKVYQIHSYIILITNFCEKIKNLYTWKDPKRSKYLIFSLILLCFIIHSLPFRIVLCILVIVVYLDGKKELKVRSDFNFRIAEEFCVYTLKKNLQVDKIDINEKWPKNDKIIKQIAEDFFQNLELIISENAFKTYDTPYQMCKEISKCRTKLVLRAGDKIQKNDTLFEECRKKVYPKRSFVENVYYYSYNFLYNIPSDFYRLRHPNIFDQQSFNQ